MAPVTRSKAGHSPSSTVHHKQTGIEKCVNFVKSSAGSVLTAYIERDCTLKERQLKRLGDHKYSAQDVSWLDQLVMKDYWEWVVQQYPLWLAPNMITLVGLLVNVFAAFTLAAYSPDGRSGAPSWTYVLCAFGLFIYQTLDATDGKQARRTGTASPLGELFDHGCDSLSQVIVSIEVALTLMAGRTEYLVLYISANAMIMFYCAHWTTYCTGTLRFTKFDVTEAQMCVIAQCLLTAVVGPEIWSKMVFGIELRMLLIGVVTVTAIYQVGGYFLVIFTGGVGKNGSTVAGTSVIYPAFPLAAVIIPHLMIYGKSDTGVFSDNIVLFVVCFGFVSAKTTNRLVIAHMSKSELELWDWIYLSPILMMLNQYYNTVIPEYYLLVFCTVYSFVSLLVHSCMICRQFCTHLNISCFTIPVAPPDNNDVKKS